jgi:hypothetical protein
VVNEKIAEDSSYDPSTYVFEFNDAVYESEQFKNHMPEVSTPPPPLRTPLHTREESGRSVVCRTLNRFGGRGRA